MADSALLADMTWPEVRAALDSGTVDTVVMAIGATEQHGPHLPLGTDAILAAAVGERLALRLGGRAVVAPPITIGRSDHHMALAGTISIGQGTLAALVTDYVRSLSAHGFRNAVLVPTHGGNFQPLASLLGDIARSVPEVNLVAYVDLERFTALLAQASRELGVSAEASGLHSGELETSLMLVLRPDLVRLDQLRPGYLGPAAEALPSFFRRGVTAVNPSGVLGDPTLACAERGEAYLARLVDDLYTFVLPRLR